MSPFSVIVGPTAVSMRLLVVVMDHVMAWTVVARSKGKQHGHHVGPRGPDC